MKQYYILENGHKLGPLTHSELKAKKITPTTYVWTTGLSDWKEAKFMEDLSDLLCELPPSPPSMPSNYLWASILSTIFCCFPLGIVGIVFSMKVSKAYYNGDYEKAEEYSNGALLFSFISAAAVIVLLLLSLTIGLIIFFSNYGYMNKLLRFI